VNGVDELLAIPFAHRGLHGRHHPENSAVAFDLAVRRGFAIELDVRLTADGVPVVFHDATMERLCGDARRVAQLPAREVCGRRLGDSDERVPTLAAAMHQVAGSVPVIVDLKGVVGQRRRLADAAAIVLRAYPGPVGVVSFDPWQLAAMRTRAPRVPRGQSAGVDLRVVARPGGRQLCYPIDELWSLRVSEADFVSFNVERLPSAAVRRVRTRMPVVAWTVRTELGYRLAQALADAVIVEGAAVDLAERDRLAA
jgi:glycerophosphoryl diester phosphodiesterase